MTTRANATSMQMQPSSNHTQFSVASPRLLDGPTEAEKAAAAEASAAATAKVAADKLAADKVIADAAEAARIAASGLSDNEAKLLKENMANKAAAKAAKEALEAANARLKDFEGLDPAEIKALVDAQKVAKKTADDAATAALEAAGEYARVKASMVEQHKAELEAIKTAGASSQAALDAALATIDDLTVGSQFNTSAYVADELVLTPTIARTVYGSNFDLVNGAVVGHDKPRGAKDRTPLVGADGNPLSFDDAMKKLISTSKDSERLIRSKIVPGARAATTDVKPGGVHRAATSGAGELRGMARISASLGANGLPVGPK